MRANHRAVPAGADNKDFAERRNTSGLIHASAWVLLPNGRCRMQVERGPLELEEIGTPGSMGSISAQTKSYADLEKLCREHLSR